MGDRDAAAAPACPARSRAGRGRAACRSAPAGTNFPNRAPQHPGPLGPSRRDYEGGRGMTTQQFDLIVIGAGSAARDGAKKAAAEYGANVALVERTRWGGSCPNVACTPTKAYLVAAELMHEVNSLAGEIGIEVGPARTNLERVRAWKETLKKPQPKWVEDLEAAGFTTVQGDASFVDAHTVRVGDRRLEADRILIATGSRTAVPPIDGIAEVGWIDHVSALELTELSESLLVVGAGAVGLEFGQIFSRFGAKVTIVDALERISPLSDAEASETLMAALVREGIEIVTNVFVKRARRDGDVIAVAQFTPVAQYQARIAIDDMFGSNGASADYSVLPTSIFTDPELAGVGLTEDEAREQGHEIEVFRNRFVRRFSYIGTQHGLFKIIFDRSTRRVLGLHVVSRGAGDVVQGFSLAVKLGATVEDIAGMHHVFPTFGEGLKAAAEQAKVELATR